MSSSTGTVVFNDSRIKAKGVIATESIGVGTTNPTSNLYVSGNAYVTSNLEVGTANLFVDTTTGNVGIGITDPGHNLDIVSEMNLRAVSNTTSIKYNSNVVTEYVRSKKLIKYPRVAMTGATTSGYTASASEFATNYNPYEAFTPLRGNGDGWFTSGSLYANDSTGAATSSATEFPVGTGRRGEYLDLQLPHAIKVSHFIIKTRAVNHSKIPEDSPHEGYLYGSNDGTNWTEIKFFSGLTYGGSSINSATQESVSVNSTTAYKYLRLQATKRGGVNGTDTYVGICELEYYGIPEYDPEAHGTDTIMRSVPNVPNTDWLEVYYDAGETSSYSGSGTTVSDIKPNGTAVNGTLRNGVGFDSTWKAFTFDGTDDYIDATISLAGGDYVHSFSAWMKVDDKSHDAYLFHLGNQANNQSIGFHTRYNANEFRYFFYGNDLDVYIDYKPHTWYHICGTYSGGGTSTVSVNLYVNGVHMNPDSNNNLGSAISIPTSTTLYIGGASWGSYLNGSIANFRLFNRALSADEIWQLYAYQKEYFQVSPDVVTFKGGRLGIGTSEPKAVLDVRGAIYANGDQSWPVPTAVFSKVTPSNQGSSYYENNIGTIWVSYNTVFYNNTAGIIGSPANGTHEISLNRTGLYEFHTESSLGLQGANASHIGHRIQKSSGDGEYISYRTDGYEVTQTDYATVKLIHRTHHIRVTKAPLLVGYYLQPSGNNSNRYKEYAWGSSYPIHTVTVKYLG